MADEVEDFFEAAGERAETLRELDRLIRDEVPELSADRHVMQGMKSPMVAYGMYHFVYASGKEDDWPVVGLANQKNYISLYICAYDETGYMAEQHADQLGKVSVGKSCIRFKQLDDLDIGGLRQLLVETERWWRQQPKPAI